METEVVKVNEGWLLVRKIPGDGNCLFSSLAHQIWNEPPGTEEHDLHTRTLRRLVVSHYRERLETYGEGLLPQAQVIFPELVGTLTPAKLIEHYLNQLGRPRFWGGEETIRAVACVFGYKVEVYSEYAAHIAIGDAGPKSRPLKIVHRINPDGTYNHYDSVIRLLDDQDELLRERQHLVSPTRCINSENDMVGNTSQQSNQEYLPPTLDLRPLSHFHLQNHWPGVVNTHAISQHSDDQDMPSTGINITDNFAVSTWNVSGCSQEHDRDLIDRHLQSNGIAIACLQETRMTTCTSTTLSYTWYNVNRQHGGARMGGGTALVVRRDMASNCRFLQISENSCAIFLLTFGEPLIIVSIYARSSSGCADPEFNNLNLFLRRLSARQRSNIIIMGDFNAHVGYRDLLPADKQKVV